MIHENITIEEYTRLKPTTDSIRKLTIKQERLIKLIRTGRSVRGIHYKLKNIPIPYKNRETNYSSM